MILAEWAEQQPYRLNKHISGAYWIPDSAYLKDRPAAFRLSDYLVSAVTGGSIWFTPGEPQAWRGQYDPLSD